jgi:hypothetical protein
MATRSSLPTDIGGAAVPRDEVSAATWAWAHRRLPRYLLAHSVRSFAWGVRLAAREGWSFDRRILWTASLLHDLGLTRLDRNTMCFEVEGAEIARSFLLSAGMPADDAERAAIAIILHMRPGVTLEDGVESVLLDRATGIDVRGDGIDQIADVRGAVTAAYPRGPFDRWFVRAIRQEAERRPTCQSARLLNEAGLEAWMARSPWRATGSGEGPGS